MVLPWLVEVEKRLAYWLTQELGGEKARIFFDKESIDIGDKWPAKLKDGLKKSKCMVGIWSPEYFRSKWCVSEWKSFQARDTILGNSTFTLVLPIRFHDGDWYPDEAKEIQSIDLRSYTSTLSAFWQTSKAVELDEKLREFAENVAKAVINAPEYNPDWPVIESEPIPTPRITLNRI